MRICSRPSRYYAVAAFLGLAVLACDDDVVVGPGVYPDVVGFWSGQYRPTDCSLSGGGDPLFCDAVFWDGSAFILELDLDVQNGSRVSGTIAQGELIGEVEGTVDREGVITLAGVIGAADDFTSTIQAWETSLVEDSLIGSWRFLVEDNTSSGISSATVDAGVKLFGPSVVKFFGCPAGGELPPEGQVADSLSSDDCQLAGGQFVEGLEDGAYFDVYALTGAMGDSLGITLRSQDFDAFLLVTSLDEEVLGGDDDSGVGPDSTDAAVTVVFDTDDTVLVIATSFEPLDEGAYTLGAERLGVSPAASADGGVKVVSGAIVKSGRELRSYSAAYGRQLRRSATRISRQDM